MTRLDIFNKQRELLEKIDSLQRKRKRDKKNSTSSK